MSPVRPAARYDDLTPAEVADLSLTVQTVSKVIEKHYSCTSRTIGLQDGPEAGQSIWVSRAQYTLYEGFNLANQNNRKLGVFGRNSDGRKGYIGSDTSFLFEQFGFKGAVQLINWVLLLISVDITSISAHVICIV